jgi:hypothetical protein
MYIPTSFFGPPFSTIVSSGSQVQGYVLYDDDLWRYDTFATGSRDYNILSGSAYFKLVVIGAGGSGGLSNVGPNNAGAAGGGGAGGFMYLENLILSSGSYTMYIGSGSTALLNGQSINGQNSFFNYIYTPTSPDPGYFLPSNVITGFGGGGGAGLSGSTPASQTERGAGNGASGGGGLSRSNGFVVVTVPQGSALYNSTELSPHGFRGGIPDTANSSSPRGTGGGGAAGVGGSNAGLKVSASLGGPGIDILSLTGYAATVCRGGNGAKNDDAGSVIGSASFGSGGAGAARTGSISLTKGIDGSILLFHKETPSALSECREFVVKGNALGGTVTYFECGTSNLVSASIDFDQDALICTKPISFRNSSGLVIDYPISDGTVTLTDTGSCSVNLEIPVNPTCDTGSGETKAELYIYTATHIPNGPPTITGGVQWLDVNNIIQSANVGGVFQPSSISFCAKEQVPPRISAFTTLEKTSLVCNYFCSSSLPVNCETWRLTCTEVPTYGEAGFYVDCNNEIQLIVGENTSGSFKEVCLNANYTPIVVASTTLGSYVPKNVWSQFSDTCP